MRPGFEWWFDGDGTPHEERHFSNNQLHGFDEAMERDAAVGAGISEILGGW